MTKSGSEWSGGVGVVKETKPGGWYKVEFDDTALGSRNFREVDLGLVKTDGDGDAAADAETDGARGDEEADFTVRFASAAVGDTTSLIGATIAELRPGWSWRNAKWAGRWQPKVKSKRREERELAFEKLKVLWPVGMHVEVEQADDGMISSWYEGEIIGHEFDNKCVVRYSELHEGDDEEEEADESKPKELFVQPELVKYLRPLPPVVDTDMHAKWAAALLPGAAADYHYDGGWWEVELVRIEKKGKSEAATDAGGSSSARSGVT